MTAIDALRKLADAIDPAVLVEKDHPFASIAQPLREALEYLEEHKAEEAPKRWRHVKRGTTYTEIGRGKLQAAYWGDGVDMTPVVVYRADADGSLWVRPVAEFEDGRFEELKP